LPSAMNRAIAGIALIGLAACSGGSVVPSGTIPSNVSANAASAVSAVSNVHPDGFIPFMSANPVRALCPRPVGKLGIRCFALMRTDIPTTFSSASNPSAYGYVPADLQSAYDLPSKKGGKGQTIALIEAYGYRTAASDLATYRKAVGLSACTIANKCLKIVNQNGATSPLPAEPPASDDWRAEQALDMDMASAICPNCKILVVQANNEDYLYPKAVELAAKLGAQVISNSYGGEEKQKSNAAFQPTGHIYVASAGDQGGNNCGVPSDCAGSGFVPVAAYQPASFANVVAAGGTTLTGSRSRGWSETVWNTLAINDCFGNCGATGSGCSAIVAKPAWQHDTVCHKRSEADASAVASVNTPVAAYSFPEGGWISMGGTSVSSPILAGVFALAGNATTVHAAETIWEHGGTKALNDVTVGDNVLAGKDNCFSAVVYICHAEKGYDGPTGWGTPHGVTAF
jgi:subtilase family serine protease